MPGTFVIDPTSTFSRVRLLSVEPKLKFGSSDEQDTNRDGVPKWVAEVAVEWHSVNGMPAPKGSEILTVTITAPTDPGTSAGVTPGQEVGFDAMWMGVSTPEAKTRDNGDSYVRGGKPWYGASALYPVTSSNGTSKSTTSSPASARSTSSTDGEG